MTHYMLKGKKVVTTNDTIEWAEWFEKSGKKRIVSQDRLPDGKLVSTVFLGVNYNFNDEGPPLVFETMVFANVDDRADLDCQRYSTWQEAEDGHKAMMKLWTKTPRH